MSTQPRIIVERGIEVGGTTFGCVRKDLKTETWSFVPTGSYSERAFRRACDFFDGKNIKYKYTIPETAANAGKMAVGLSVNSEVVNSDAATEKLLAAADEFLARPFYGYKPLDNLEK